MIDGYKELSELLEYKDGLLYWKVSPNYNIKVGDIAGSVDRRGYIRIGYKRKHYKAHRLIWFMHYGEIPDTIDHINNDPSDNRIENLRNCTQHENAMNQSTQKVSKSSKYKGVSYSKTPRLRKRWLSYITINKKRQYIGSFETEEEAAIAYNSRALELFGVFARLNCISASDATV